MEELHTEAMMGSHRLQFATYEPDSEFTRNASIHGCLVDSAMVERFADSATIRSLMFKTGEDSAIRFTLEDGKVTYRQYGEPLAQSDADVPDSQLVYTVANIPLYAMWSVDRCIDQNGLRPVVDEVKERRWTITLACAAITALSQTGNL